MLMAIACAIKCDAQFVDIPFTFYELSRFKGSSEGSLSVYLKGKNISVNAQNTVVKFETCK